MADGIALCALPEEQGLGGRRVLQCEGPGSLLPRPARGARGERSRDVRDARRSLRAVPERALLRALQGGQRLAQHVALERGAVGERAAPDVGVEGGTAIRRGAAQPRRCGREGGCADRLHQGAGARSRLRGSRAQGEAPGALVCGPGGLVPRSAERAGGSGERALAHAPRRDDPEGAQSALEHLRRAAPGS